MISPRRPRRAALLALLLACFFVPDGPAAAQQAPRSGLVEAALRLRRLDGVKRVLMIAAHPDDESSALLATFATGMGVETAYLSLTRGDGGQNVIGPELMEELGIVRTGELVAARAIDGGRQFFTRAVDYGFSKSAEEAFSHWPRDELLRDVVWVIRRFRPQVIVSVFSGTQADGHGQHQVAGILAAEGFEVAGDPNRFPEQLEHVEPWQPAKLFRNARADPAGTPMTVVETGTFDPLLGRSWYQLAMEGRSQHRSQDMGTAQSPGPRSSNLVLVRSTVNAEAGADLFAGIDTTLAALVRGLPAAVRTEALEQVQAYREAIREAEASLGVIDPDRAVPPLARSLRHLESLAQVASAHGPYGDELARAVSHHAEGVRAALLAAAGIVVDAAAGDALLVPGQETTLTVTVWNGGELSVAEVRSELFAPDGWSVAATEPAPDGPIEPGQLALWSFTVRVPDDAQLTEPYFLRRPRDGDLYRWPDDPSLWGLPEDPPLLRAGATFEVETLPGAPPVVVATVAEAEFVGVDQISGEYRERVVVVPAVSVATDQSSMVWPTTDQRPRDIAVRLRGEAKGGVAGTVRVEVPEGWAVEPASIPFEVAVAGSVTSVTFRVTPDADGAAGRVVLRAVAEDPGGERWDRAVRIIDYPHIRRVAHLLPAEVAVTRVPMRVAEGLRVGYVMGTGDGGFEALRQIGVAVELLSPERVRAEDFSRFSAIVVGVRAYETRPDLVAANARLLEFARAGGTVIVQYQQYQYPAGDFAPYPVAISRPHDRVTDETAPVRVLDTAAPVFTTPHRITAEDFAGWVHERGLYFLSSWDERFTALLEMADPGEAPLRGSLLVAPVGAGLYAYTGLAFFRQFPAGVPGAYRLFANVVSLDPASWNRHIQQQGEGAR